MLQTLHIENIAVIRKGDIDLASGFSVFSGETGAGKSILIDSIGFLLGRRGGRELLRTGTDKATVSALFTVEDERTRALLSELGVFPDENGELLLERHLVAEGRTTARLNGRPLSLSLLRTAGEILCSIHGQSETRVLTEKENQLAILDGYAEDAALYAAYLEIYERLVTVEASIREISSEESARLREIEMLRYQIADIEALSLREGEEEKLEEKKRRLRSMERISKQAGFAYRALRAGEKANVLYILERAITAVESLGDVIGEAESIATELVDCRARIEDAAERIRAFSEDGENAADLLDAVEGRLAAIEKLRRKYGGTVKEILAYLASAKERYSLLSEADARLDELERDRERLLAEAAVRAAALTAARKAAGEELAARVCEVLGFLDMPRVRFAVSVLPRREGEGAVYRRDGADAVEFLLATNPGEPLLPLSSIASGGELARIMLAIKSVIADRDGIGTVIYDEIDAGVSGKTARKLGIELMRSARGTQVLCVTHSAQIASLADSHYLIKKTEKDGRAETEVLRLDEEGRIKELSRILGGIEVTEAQRLAAAELYAERKAYQEG